MAKREDNIQDGYTPTVEEVNISRDEAISMLHRIGVKTNGKSEKEIDTLIRDNLGLNFNEEPIDYIPLPSVV